MTGEHGAEPTAAPVRRLVGAVLGLVALTGAFHACGDASRLDARMRGLHFFQLEGRHRSLITTFPSLDSLNGDVIPRFLAPAPRVSRPAGRYPGPVTVEAHVPAPAVVRYTLDGSLPTERSPLLTGPVRFERTGVLRVRSFLRGRLPGEPVTRTYLIGEPAALPAFALTLDPEKLWNPLSGLFERPHERGPAWVRLARAEYVQADEGPPSLAFPVRLRIHGNWSRELPKKGLQVIYPARAVGVDGAGTFFASPTGRERRVVLRADNSALHWRFADELFHTLYAGIGGLASAHEPTHVYLNGAYWGIYNLRERIDGEYLARHRGPGRYDLIETKACHTPGFVSFYACYVAVEGDLDAWQETLGFFRTAEFSADAAVAEAARRVDLDNLTDYWIANVFGANGDWPISNVYAFRRRTDGDGRWRWIAWDADWSFRSWARPTAADPDADTALAASLHPGARPDRPVGDGYEGNWRGTLLMRRLVENPAFRARAVGRFCDLLNTAFSAEQTRAALDHLVRRVEPDVDHDLRRWDVPRADYDSLVTHYHRWLQHRPDRMRRQLRDVFGLGPEADVRVDVAPARAGRVRVNTVEPDRYPWAGRYFAGMRVRLEAVPAPGFRFAGWSDPALGARAVAFVDPGGEGTVTARFARVGG